MVLLKKCSTALRAVESRKNVRRIRIYRKGEATPVNMFTSTLSNQFIAREGEAPAEPWRRQARQEPRPPVVH